MTLEAFISITYSLTDEVTSLCSEPLIPSKDEVESVSSEPRIAPKRLGLPRVQCQPLIPYKRLGLPNVPSSLLRDEVYPVCSGPLIPPEI